jgi:hypothetical protein
MSFTDFSCLRFLALLFCFASLASAEEKTSGDWKYSVDAGGTGTIVQYTGSESDVSVPAALERVKITHIGDNAFALTANYEGTDSLTRVVLPEGVSEIGTAAFEYRKKLKNVVISGSVERIGFWPFSNCDALANIEVKPENNAYSSSDGVLFNKEDKTLFHYPVGKPDKTYTIPSWVEVIGGCAFVKAKNLNEVIIPEGVKVIGLRAFDEASSLQNLSIPASVETIRDNAFYGCASLTNISVPTDSKSFAGVDGVLFDKEKKVLWQYPAAKGGEYSVPDGVAKIGKFAFQGASNLQSVLIPASLTETVDDNVFGGCASLKSISVATNNLAFASVDGVLFDKEQKVLREYPAGRSGEYSVPDGVTTIDKLAFRGSQLTNVIVPNTVTSISKWAFSYSALTSATLPEALLSKAGSFGFSKELAARLEAQAPPSPDKAKEDRTTASNKAPEQSVLPSLTVGGATYKNVILKKEYPVSLFIKHDEGTVFVKRNELTEEQLTELAGTAGN